MKIFLIHFRIENEVPLIRKDFFQSKCVVYILRDEEERESVCVCV